MGEEFVVEKEVGVVKRLRGCRLNLEKRPLHGVD
jgi:hypothetical protein